MSINVSLKNVKPMITRAFGKDAIFFESLKKYNTFGVGGVADCIIDIKDEKSLIFAIKLLNKYKIPFVVLGNGSNVLISDKGYRGVVLILKNFKGVLIENNSLTANAGENLNNLILTAKKHNLCGLEWLYNIPATVGGAVAINAGAFNTSIFDKLEKVKVLKDNKVIVYEKKDIDYGYRYSRFLDTNEIIISAKFSLDFLDEKEIDLVIKRVKELRNGKPTFKTCGSVFKNPNGYYAGKLIETLNLKGKKIGGAKISERHANFIECEKDACALDIYLLINYVKNTIYDKFGILLETEVKFIGEF